MRGFTRDYFLALIGLYLIFYSPFSPISHTINLWQKDFLILSLKPLLNSFEFINYHIIINPYYHLEVTSRCTSSIPLFLFFAFMIADKRDIKRRVIYSIIGFVVINIFNIFRIYIVTIVVKYDPTLLFWIHSVGGNIILGIGIFLVLGLYST